MVRCGKVGHTLVRAADVGLVRGVMDVVRDGALLKRLCLSQRPVHS